MSSEFWWWIARSSGIVAWVALTASVLWGLLMPATFSKRQRRAWILDLHRWLGALTVGFTALHMAALWLDSYIEFSPVDLFVPFASAWKPGPVALGVVSMWAIAAVQVSSMLKRRLSRTVWRSLHLLSYVAFFGGTVHGILAGTDATQPLYQATTFLTVGAVCFTTVYRVLTRRRRSRPPSQASAGRSATVATRTASLSSSVTR